MSKRHRPRLFFVWSLVVGTCVMWIRSIRGNENPQVGASGAVVMRILGGWEFSWFSRVFSFELEEGHKRHKMHKRIRWILDGRGCADGRNQGGFFTKMVGKGLRKVLIWGIMLRDME